MFYKTPEIKTKRKDVYIYIYIYIYRNRSSASYFSADFLVIFCTAIPSIKSSHIL
jgi:hypothetical protein